MKIWYDLSDLYDWEGNFTGIQRVVYNLAKKISDDIRAHFFVYRNGVFFEISIDELEENLAQSRRTPFTPQGHPKYTAKHALGKLKRTVTSRTKNTIKGSRLESSARKAYLSVRAVYRKSKTELATKDRNKDIFSPDDIVLVMGGNWHLDGYIENLLIARGTLKFKLVHSVNDIIALVNPAFVNEGGERIIGQYFQHVISHADQLLAISESTKKDIEGYARTTLSKHPAEIEVKVIELGDEIVPAKSNPQQPKIDIADSFVLSVGTIEIRKNYRLLYNTYKLAHQRGIELPQLIIVGKRGWMADETYALLTRDTELRNKIVLLQGIPDEELEWLYANCAFTIFPSMYEGWGLPIAESLQHGKCCITTNVSSMPEVGGKLALYVSPYDTAEMLAAINKLSNTEYRQAQELKIASTYRSRTWDQTYVQLRRVLDM